MKKFLLSAISICMMAATSFAQPVSNPDALPTLTANQVISVYTGVYTDLTNVNFNPFWGQSGFASATTFTLSGNEMRHYPNMNYQGIDIKNGGANPPQNVSSLETLNIDVWSSNCTSLDIYLVADNNTEKAINRTLTLNAWNRLQIPLLSYADLGVPLNAIKEFKFVAITPNSGANIYVDNIFFFTTKQVPTFGAFTIPSKTVGDAPFAITAPTSNSMGAFSYSSSNTNVATISGNMITIVGGGTSVITATQAASAPFSQGSTSTDFVVNFPPPPMAAPAPPGRAASDVVSLFSGAFTSAATMNVADWSPAGNTVQVVQAGGNDVLEMKTAGGAFNGFNLSNAINLTDMTFLHYDIWIAGTPEVGAVFNTTVSQHGLGHLSGQTVGYVHTNPISTTDGGKWLSFDIPFSDFAPSLAAGAKDIVSQIVFTHANKFGGGPVYLDNLYFYRPGVLPVKLVSFSALVKANTVGLNWETATEINNRGFGVERSGDGRTWTELAFVNASPSNRNGAKYASLDMTPIQGMNYYRLRQVDLDGKFAYSAVRQVNFNGKDQQEISIYPNPSRGFVNVLANQSNTPVQYSITDLSGKSVQSGVLRADGAVNRVNIQTLPAGIYMIKVTDEKGPRTSKLVVQ